MSSSFNLRKNEFIEYLEQISNCLDNFLSIRFFLSLSIWFFLFLFLLLDWFNLYIRNFLFTYFIYFIKPRDKNICFPAVLLPLYIIFIFFLRKWHTWYEPYNQSNKYAWIDCNVSHIYRDWHQPYSPPHYTLSKIVWMPWISP